MHLTPVPVSQWPEEILQEAQELASKSPLRTQHGAVITKRRRVLARGFNSFRTHPKWGSSRNIYGSLHAECDALYDAQKQGLDLRGTELWVYRRNGLLSKPCPDCERKIRAQGVQLVRYSA